MACSRILSLPNCPAPLDLSVTFSFSGGTSWPLLTWANPQRCLGESGRKANFIKYFTTKIQLLILYLFHLTKQRILFVVEMMGTLIQTWLIVSL